MKKYYPTPPAQNHTFCNFTQFLTEILATMLNKLLIISALLLTSFILPAQIINVSGQYLDKNSNPINNALVSYYASGDLLLDTTRSLVDGNFELTLDLTSVNTNSQSVGYFINKPYPNPFNGLCSFTININTKATIIITNMQGLTIDKYEIEKSGVYQCTWGGQNHTGQQVNVGSYNVSLVTDNLTKTHKVIFNGNSSQRIKSEKISGDINLKSNGRDQDRINFIKTNTSELDYFINPVSGDTTLGIITGNVGPEVLGQIISTVHIDETNTWNLNNYFYNDDQSVYTTTNSNFTISNDSIMTYVGTELGTFTFDINATDPQDGTLVAQTLAQITVTNEQAFNCSGYYLDNQQLPISGATITYWESGNIYAVQTTSTGSGYWSLSVMVSNTGEDKIGFVKGNTTELELFFPTPSADTTFGDVAGNIGPEALSNIDETHFTIDGNLSWNLNNHFTNDDQNNYAFTGSDYTIFQDTLLELSTEVIETFSTTVTATDPQDASLTAQITSDVVVEYTIIIPDTNIIEDYQGDTLFDDLNQYINPNYQENLTYSIVNQSNSTLIDLMVQDSLIMITNLQADSSGSSYVGVKVIGSNDTDTVFFTVNVNAMPDVSGYITDIFDTLNVGIEGVSIEMTLDSITFYYDTTDANGYYSIETSVVNDTVYYVTTITKAGYTTFHTWATVEAGAEYVSEDYKVIPEDFIWELYLWGGNNAWHGNGGVGGWHDTPYQLPGKNTTRHWREPVVNAHIYSDNSLVSSGFDLTPNVNNHIYNLENILPTFNPRDAPTVMTIHPSFGYTIQDGEYGAYWDNTVPGVGIVGRVWNGLRMEKCTTGYRDTVGRDSLGLYPGPDNNVFNQEIGSCFGSVNEPDRIDSLYNSVFTDPTPENTYTPDDYDCETVYLARSKVHYRNLYYSASDPEGWDWELRPDLVNYYYSPSTTNSRIFEFVLFGENGSVIEKGAYPLDDVPSRVMKMAKLMFTPEEIASREKKEAQLGFKLKKWLRDNTREKANYKK